MGSTLSIGSTHAVVAVSIAAMAMTLMLGWMACRRARFRRQVVSLELLRLLLVGFAVFLLNQPELLEELPSEVKPTFAVLVDQSASMMTRDIETGTKTVGTREQAVAPVLDESTWSELSRRGDVVRVPFASEGAGHATDLHQVLSSSEKQYPNLRAIVLASDGDWNTGPPPVEAAAELRARGVPIFVVPVGSVDRMPDLQLLRFDVPAFAAVGKPLRIPLTLESSLSRDHLAVVSLTDSDGDVLKKEFMIEPMSRTNEAIVWTPRSLGSQSLTLSLAAAGEERILDNNELSASLTVREEKLNVLIVESQPRWEYRFLRNALSRDPAVEVSCLLFHPGLSKRGGGNRDYIQSFPEDLGELTQYDVVFLGDVGVGKDQLTLSQTEQVRGLVEQHASGLVVVPGIAGHTLSLVDTPIGDLLPVDLDRSRPSGQGSELAHALALTESGRRSLLTRLADDEDDNRQVWDRLPGFQWHAPVIRAKQGSDVLAVDRDASNEHGRIPLMVTQSFGNGKVLFVGFDSVWRWRSGVEDLYHYRFWGQVVRWMAYQRNMAKGKSIRLFYSPEQPHVGQTLSLTATVLDDQRAPLSDGDVSIETIAPSGKAESVQLNLVDPIWGVYAGNYTPSEAGSHKMKLWCKETSETLETSVFVQLADVERIGKPARPEVLEELAKLTRGRVLRVDEIASFADTLLAMPDPPAEVRRVRLWSHPATVLVMIGLAALFWIGRKMAGLT
ncbi:vWA domain-containing protein [Novipirellula artificiosorum]|uniref:VWFA domain-containing protein n=1 Tax=Novipirellula artificiosorum TaxID=2528016 RepID=A0A5C6E505_9BACT|nr:vWA domain-containing protein [Novipirellula artificiosorum]TWU42239.1 hypothetical protein Poly41_05350 [Novipirellula artificiosorum]